MSWRCWRFLLAPQRTTGAQIERPSYSWSPQLLRLVSSFECSLWSSAVFYWMLFSIFKVFLQLKNYGGHCGPWETSMNQLGFFFFASPDLRVNTILSLNSARNPFHFMAWFFFWCGLSAATRYEWSMWPWHRASPIKEAATRGPQCRIDRVSMFYWLEVFCINILGG